MIGLGGAARIRDWSKVNLVFDGNSLVQGVGASVPATTALPAQLAQIAPISGVIPANNIGVSGQTVRQMDGLDGGSSADVDGAYVSGKANVLCVWEGTNSICNNSRSPDDTISDLKTYIANRQAGGRRWLIMVLTTLPRQNAPAISGQTGIDTYNGYLAQFNATIMANYRQLGADAVCDVRQAGSPFAFTDYSPTSFAANNALWNEAAGGRVHLTDAGYAIIAGYIAAQWPRMPFRLAV